MSPSGRLTGSVMTKVVPFPTWLWTLICPWCILIIPYTIDNPNPVPLSKDFVVKKGEKILSRLSLGIPEPVSEMLISSQLWSIILLVIVMVPSASIASAEFLKRLIKTCCIWSGSTFMEVMSGSKLRLNLTSWKAGWAWSPLIT